MSITEKFSRLLTQGTGFVNPHFIFVIYSRSKGVYLCRSKRVKVKGRSYNYPSSQSKFLLLFCFVGLSSPSLGKERARFYLFSTGTRAAEVHSKLS